MVSFLHAQDIPKSQVPSVIINKFNTQFPKASDIEWEKEGSLYNADFEIGWRNDHKVWYNVSAEIVKHIEEVSTKNLPVSIKTVLQKNYKGYKIDDVKKIKENEKITYKVEIEKFNKEDKTLLFNEHGILI